LTQVRLPKVTGKLPLFPKRYRSTLTYELRRGLVFSSKVVEHYWKSLPVPDLIRKADRAQVRLVWKSIESTGRLGLLARSLPDAHAIHIVRHPCGTIASVLRGEARGNFTATEPASEDYGIIRMLLETPSARSRSLDLDVIRSLTSDERLAWIWALINENAINDTAAARNCTTVRYEDLCADPLGVARRLFDFADLTWHRQTEDFVLESTGQDTGAFYSVYKDPAKSVSRWREELSGTEIRQILDVARSTAPGRLFEEAS
jgi:hypothetical protein